MYPLNSIANVATSVFEALKTGRCWDTPGSDGRPATSLTDRQPVASLVATVLLALIVLCGCGSGHPPAASTGAPAHLVVLGDPHLPGNNLAAKRAVLARINSWRDVALVVAVGDLTERYGTESEYAAAADYFRNLRHPLAPIVGNHDYFFQTPYPLAARGYVRAPFVFQQAKLTKFRQTFGLDQHYYKLEIDGYLLLFLSTDHDRFGTGISEAQLAWLRNQLFRHRNQPTIIFAHPPLQGTQTRFRHYVNRPNAVIQPAAWMHMLLITNPQVFLWVSGHTHTPPTETSYASFINIYADRIVNIHNNSMKRDTIWSNSLYLYPDRVQVRTFNHRENRWQAEFDRTILVSPSR